MPTIIRAIFMMLVFILGGQTVLAQDEGGVLSYAKRWAEVQYQLEGDAQTAGFEALIDQLDAALVAAPNSAELLTWRGIVKASLAGSKGGLGALSLVKQARKDFETAIATDDNALQGAAYTSLGSLYYQVPGWPLSFGDTNKAEQHLRQGLTLAPADIDANYFYADFLLQQGRLDEAKVYITKAEAAPPRPLRPLADAGRRKQLAELKKKVE
ncbi:Tetratricopeptide repeat [Spongiibacter sp. IMCC21906]|jgi:tetratricopeptide (TPR) repeat protein|uniref:tetratricopeptide repeat protein n=1 Tax=Spongiibacter sp. IMCC21906 TaxID=1620392 RepID=UPI00062DD9FB|nr:tetratricopeptide repeat protein [Spongiibacter sp. IMCC21906]AKH70825.1 Tetratricopeptide repeat [Spongiibacter sp. IMCC21906]